MKSETRNAVSKFAVFVCAAAVGLAAAGPAAAKPIDDVRAKVNQVHKHVTRNLPRKVDAVRRDIRAILDRLPNPVEDLGSGLGDRQTMAAILESVQPVAQMLRERADQYRAFDAEAFRYDLAVAINNIANMQLAVAGRVGPGVARIQEKVYELEPFVLFALSQTPLVSLLESTAGMTEELQTLGRITGAAVEHIKARQPANRVKQLVALNMSIAAPDYVSCTFVLENVTSDDIADIKLSRLRAKQISGVAALALHALPKQQTIGVNVVGGGTVSIPNPLTPMTATIKKASDNFYTISRKWTKKYDDCKKSAVYGRLSDFLDDQGYTLEKWLAK